MNKLTIPYSIAVLCVHLDNMVHHKMQLDSKDDQKSIRAGYSH